MLVLLQFIDETSAVDETVLILHLRLVLANNRAID